MRITWRTISGILYFFYFFFWSPIYPVCVSLLFPGIKLLWSLNLDMLQITEVTNLNLLVIILIRIQNHPSDNFMLPFNKSQETKTLDPTPENERRRRRRKGQKRWRKEQKSKKQKGHFKWSRALLFKIRITIPSFSPTHNSWKHHLSWSPNETSLCKILACVA